MDRVIYTYRVLNWLISLFINAAEILDLTLTPDYDEEGNCKMKTCMKILMFYFSKFSSSLPYTAFFMHLEYLIGLMLIQ